jgi:hypothetical protein
MEIQKTFKLSGIKLDIPDLVELCDIMKNLTNDFTVSVFMKDEYKISEGFNDKSNSDDFSTFFGRKVLMSQPISSINIENGYLCENNIIIKIVVIESLKDLGINNPGYSITASSEDAFSDIKGRLEFFFEKVQSKTNHIFHKYPIRKPLYFVMLSSFIIIIMSSIISPDDMPEFIPYVIGILIISLFLYTLIILIQAIFPNVVIGLGSNAHNRKIKILYGLFVGILTITSVVLSIIALT